MQETKGRGSCRGNTDPSMDGEITACFIGLVAYRMDLARVSAAYWL